MQSLWMLVASLLFAVMGACVKLAAAQYSIAEIVFYRSLLGCIGLVLTAELFNSAIETLYHNLDAETKRRAQPCLDVAAAAVLMAAGTALLVGGLVFAQQLARVFFAE